MGGVGSFESENVTLYVGHIARGGDMESSVRKHFGEFGDIVSGKSMSLPFTGAPIWTRLDE